MRMAWLALTLILLSPVAEAAKSGLSYFEASHSTLEPEGGDVVELNRDGDLLATGHDGSVSVFRFPSLEEVGSVMLRNKVTNLRFSPDSDFLIIGLKSSGSHKESIQKMLIDDELQLEDMSSTVSSHAIAMDMHPNGNLVAITDDDMGVSIFGTSDLIKSDEISGGHLADVTCIDYSDDGKMIVTGDESGNILLRNTTDELITDSWTVTDRPTSCTISSDSTRVLSSSEDGQIVIRDVASQTSLTTSLGQTSKASWSGSENRINVIIGGEKPQMLVLKAEDLTLLYETSLFHQANDFVVVENDREIVESLIVATGTGNVAHYVRSIERPVTTEADTDRDGIPNREDIDADGDGIIKWWDINCESGVDCDSEPDLNTIRRISVEVTDEEFTIRDVVFFDMDRSAMIRNISRSSLVEDLLISEEEISLFSQSACENLDEDDLIEKWSDLISLSSGGFSGDVVIDCKVLAGMHLISSEDHKTLIQFELSITWKLDQRPLIPYSLEMKDQPESTDASITQITPFHPSSLRLTDSNGEGEFIDLWWGDNSLNLNVSEKEVIEPTFSEKTKSFVMDNPWVGLPFLILLGIGLLTLIRRRNRISLDGEICEVCGTINPLKALLCKECGALFVHDQVMKKLHGWMIKNEMSARDMFDKFDEDGNGTLETDELVRGLRSLRIAALPLSQVEALVESLDEDGNGVIDFEEFQAAIGNAELIEETEEDISEQSPPRPKRGPPPSKRNPQPKEEVISRRRRVESTAMVDGPITSSKRRRLDTAIPEEEPVVTVRKRKVVKMGDDVEPVIRKKKAVKKVEEKPKRRKAVRRKK